LNPKYKKLKQMKRVIKSRKGNVLKRPQFRKYPIPRIKRVKKLRYTTPQTEVDATGTMIGAGSATVRTSSHIGIFVLKKIREKSEETREAEKESAKIQGGSHGW